MSIARVAVWTALLVVLARFDAPTLAQQVAGSLLKPEWKPGEKTYVEIRLERTTKTHRVGGEPATEESKRTETWGFGRQIESVTPDGGATFKLAFERVALALAEPQRHVNFDSDIDDPQAGDNPLRTLLTPLLGKVLTVEIDGQGAVKGVTGVAELRRALEAAHVDAKQIEDLHDLLSEQWHTFVWNRIYAVYPFKVVRADDVWHHDLGYDEEPLDYTYRYRRSQQRGDVYMALVAFNAERPERYSLPDSVAPGETRQELGRMRVDGIGMLDRAAGRFAHVHERRDGEQRVLQKDANGTLNVTRTNTILISKCVQYSEEERRTQQEEHKKQRPASVRDRATSRVTPTGEPGPDDLG